MSRLLRISTWNVRDGSVTYKIMFLSFCDTLETGKLEKSNTDPVFGREGVTTIQISSSCHELQYSWSREAVHSSGSFTDTPEASAKLEFFASRAFAVLQGGLS